MTNVAFDQANEPRISAPAVRKALRVLDVIAAEYGAGISEIARRTHLSKSTVHGLVSALLDEGALAPRDGGLVLGPRLAALASTARSTAVLELAKETVSALARETGETALFGRLDGESVTILIRADGPRPLTVSAQVGARVPVSAQALAGAAPLALDLDRHTGAFAIDRGEYLPGIAGIATALSWCGMVYFVWIVTLDALYDHDSLARFGKATSNAAAGLLDRLVASAGGGMRKR